MKYIYPENYTVKPLKDQIEEIADVFVLNKTAALTYMRNLPDLPEGAEGWFAIPSIEGLVRSMKNVPNGYDDRYALSLSEVLNALTGWNSGVNRHNVRMSEKTRKAMRRIEKQQANSDILIIAAQLGLSYAGKSVNAVRKGLPPEEFGLTALAVGSILLTHPERYEGYTGKNEAMDIDCAGDESLMRKDKMTAYPVYYYSGGEFNIDLQARASKGFEGNGSATGFLVD